MSPHIRRRTRGGTAYTHAKTNFSLCGADQLERFRVALHTHTHTRTHQSRRTPSQKRNQAHTKRTQTKRRPFSVASQVDDGSRGTSVYTTSGWGALRGQSDGLTRAIRTHAQHTHTPSASPCIQCHCGLLLRRNINRGFGLLVGVDFPPFLETNWCLVCSPKLFGLFLFLFSATSVSMSVTQFGRGSEVCQHERGIQKIFVIYFYCFSRSLAVSRSHSQTSALIS